LKNKRAETGIQNHDSGVWIFRAAAQDGHTRNDEVKFHAYGDFMGNDRAFSAVPIHPPPIESPLQSLPVNGYTWAISTSGRARRWCACMVTLATSHLVGRCSAPADANRNRVIACSMAAIFPNNWDGVGAPIPTPSMSNGNDDRVISGERSDTGPGRTDGGFPWRGHISFRGRAQRTA